MRNVESWNKLILLKKYFILLLLLFNGFIFILNPVSDNVWTFQNSSGLVQALKRIIDDSLNILFFFMIC